MWGWIIFLLLILVFILFGHVEINISIKKNKTEAAKELENDSDVIAEEKKYPIKERNSK